MVYVAIKNPEYGVPSFTSDDFYRTVFENSHVAYYVVSVTEEGFAFLDANEAAAKIAGVPITSLRGCSLEDCLLPEIAECLTAGLEECIRTGKEYSYVRQLDLPSGRVAFKTTLVPVIQSSSEIHTVVGITRDATGDERLIGSASHNAALLHKLGIALPSAIFLLHFPSRQVRFIGQAHSPEAAKWRQSLEEAGPLALIEFLHPDDLPKSEAHRRRLAKLRDGEVIEVNYRVRSDDGTYRRHHLRETVFSRNAGGELEYVLGISEDMAEQDRVLRDVRDLSAQIATLQTDERRRIAQELHDSTGQHLTAAGLALGHVRALHVDRSTDNERDDALSIAIDDAARLLREAQHEIRVLSYLLHPPQIRSGGLAGALTSFATGFGKRAGLEVDLQISPDTRTIEDDIAIHIFRICQEALTNVYRHAHADGVAIELRMDDHSLTLLVRDDGIGFDTSAIDALDASEGLGLSGVRERMVRLGGTLSITSRPGNTELIATMPRNSAGAVG